MFTESQIFNPEVFIFDIMMPNECCAGIWLQQAGGEIIPVDRVNDWRLPENIEELITGKNVLIVGTYSKENVEIIRKFAKSYRVYVYNESDLTFDDYAVTSKGIWHYVYVNTEIDDYRLERVCALFDQRQTETLSRENRALIQAVKSIKQRSFFEKISQFSESTESIDDLIGRGLAELDVCESISEHWYSQSLRGKIFEHVCRVGHANPFIHDTADLFFDHDNEVYVVIVYRIEGTKFRFTIVTKGEIDAREIAVQYGGGGAKNMAGFATDLVSGATVLDYILRQNE